MTDNDTTLTRAGACLDADRFARGVEALTASTCPAFDQATAQVVAARVLLAAGDDPSPATLDGVFAMVDQLLDEDCPNDDADMAGIATELAQDLRRLRSRLVVAGA